MFSLFRSKKKRSKGEPAHQINKPPELQKKIIRTKIRGVSFSNPDGTSRQSILKCCKESERLILKHRPLRGHPTAVAIYRKSGQQLGYVSSSLSKLISVVLGSGRKVDCKILNLTGGSWFRKRTRGCNIQITIHNWYER